MRIALTLPQLTWLPAVAALAAGLAWLNCTLLAGSCLLAALAFRQGMQRHVPWQGWRAALQCIFAGLAMFLGSLGLLISVGGVIAGWWAPLGAHPDSAGLLLLAIVVLLGLFRLERPSGGARLRAGVAASVAAAAAWLAADRGLPYAACAFAVGVALWLVREGWRLSHEMGSALLKTDG